MELSRMSMPMSDSGLSSTGSIIETHRSWYPSATSGRIVFAVRERWHAATAIQAYNKSGDWLARRATSAEKWRSGSPASSWTVNIFCNLVRHGRGKAHPVGQMPLEMSEEVGFIHVGQSRLADRCRFTSWGNR